MTSQITIIIIISALLLAAARVHPACVHDHLEAPESQPSSKRAERETSYDVIFDDVFTAGKTELQDFFAPIRVRLWFDEENIDFPCGSEEFRHLVEQTQRAVDKLTSFISGERRF